MIAQIYVDNRPKIEVKRRVRRRIRARRALVSARCRLERYLLQLIARYITPIQMRLDRLGERMGDLEAEICEDLRSIGPLVVGEYLYYPIRCIGPDGEPYDELVTGNVRSALDRREAEREFAAANGSNDRA